MNKVVFFFDGFESILRVLVVGTLLYFALVISLRISGQRTLSQMKAFDFVITIGIGSTFGRAITAEGLSLAEGVTAVFLLILLQYIVAWLTVKSSRFSRLVSNDPILLYFQGDFLREAMQKNRVTRQELLSMVRQQGLSSLDEVEAIVMESSGKFAVIKNKEGTDHSALGNLSRQGSLGG